MIRSNKCFSIKQLLTICKRQLRKDNPQMIDNPLPPPPRKKNSGKIGGKISGKIGGKIGKKNGKKNPVEEGQSSNDRQPSP